MSATTDTKLSRLDIEQLPNYRKQTANEWSAACPFCSTGDDRFRYWPEDGNFWCRVCEAKGFVTEANTLSFDKEQWQRWQEAEQGRKAEARQKELTTLEKLNQSKRLYLYHKLMDDRTFWYEKGLNDSTIEWFELGYCPSCPTYPQSASYTIPIVYQGRVFNIRHRLVNPGDSGKYRPEMAGLPTALFNADALYSPDWMTVLVEGEIKTMVLEQNQFSTVGIPGANSFKPKWASLFSKCKMVYVALDPGAEEQAVNIAKMLRGAGVEVRIAKLPVKPDDFFVIYGGAPSEFMEFLRLGEKA